MYIFAQFTRYYKIRLMHNKQTQNDNLYYW